MTNGVCDDCGKTIQVGEWPFGCEDRGHTLYIKLAFIGKGRTKDYAPPTPLNPIKEPSITRDWMNLDGSTRPMEKGEWNKSFVGVDA